MRPLNFLRTGASVLRTHGGIAAVLLLALFARLVYLDWFRVFPPGDVYNFLEIAAGLPEGRYKADEKRLPFYPLLTLTAHSLGLDWEPAALTVAVLAFLQALLLLYALGRTLGISKTALTAVLATFAVHPQALFATRAYADTTLLALLPAVLLALIRARTAVGALGTGLLAAAAATTRYEGLLAAPVALLLWFLLPRGRPRRLPALALLSFVLGLMPYVALSKINHRPLFGVGYLEEAAKSKTYGVETFGEWWSNVGGILRRTGILGSWDIPGAVVRDLVGDPFAAPRTLLSRAVDPGEPLALLAASGLVLILVRRRWRELLLVGVPLTATILAPAWNRPFPRYDLFVLPLTFLLAGAGLTGIQKLVRRGTTTPYIASRLVRGGAALVLAVVVGLFWIPTYARKTREQQTKHVGREYAYYQAIHRARALPGTIVFARAGAPTEFYFGSRALYLKEHLTDAGVPQAEFLAAARRAGARYAVFSAAETAKVPFADDLSVRTLETFAWPLPDSGTSNAVILALSD